MKPTAFTHRPLWSDNIPFASAADSDIRETLTPGEDGIDRITGVTTPALTFYPASGRGPHPAVLVCPGGGYSILAWNHEGTDIAAWLNANGISAFVLKYRCPDRREAALADAARAMRTLRANTEAFDLMPDKIGIIGFSAGAHLAARVCNLAAPDVYAPADDIDAFDPRPDFCMLIYPAYLSRENWTTDPDLAISAQTPPTFIMQAEDDGTLIDSSIAYYIALKAARVPAEMHLFSRGGHGYGMFRNGNPTQAWPALAVNWFRTDVMKCDAWQGRG